MDMDVTYAPGWPGSSPRWNSSAKSGVGTALTHSSQVWFTTSHGILNEIYYPRVDIACIRDMGFLVGDGKDYFSEEKRHAHSELQYMAEGAPAYRFINTCTQGRYRIEKEVLTDPRRETLLQQVKFTPLSGGLADYHLYALLAPHIGNAGFGNTAWCGAYKGIPMLFAKRDGTSVAMACSLPFIRRSVGFVGESDAWQDISKNKQMTQFYQRAENGNVAICGEIDLQRAGGQPFQIAIGFGRNENEAGQRAFASILEGFDNIKQHFIAGWQNWQRPLNDLAPGSKPPLNLYRISAAVIHSHEASQFPGGFIAGLSVPWGTSKGDDDLGGYHLVWPRDLVETAGGLLAAGANDDALRVLNYLQVTQEPDGHWLQNMWLDGSPYWQGVQMDETAFPILLIHMLFRLGVIKKEGMAKYRGMTEKAAGYIVCNGPASQQDRWEENGGFSPFTLAVEITALLAAADLYTRFGENDKARYLTETADTWNDNIENWTYVKGTELAKELGIEGYYVRIAPPDVAETPDLEDDVILIKNLVYGAATIAEKIISPDALALVRFGLRAADDPRMLNTVKAIDSLLKVTTPFGDCWHRYNNDGYGEHADGSPFDGTGTGRAWPLLTGERAHYEIAAGNFKRAQELFETMSAFANEGGMISEQVWDTDDIPEKELFFGRPSGSAMPLVWAHGEYIKLCRSLQDKKVFDMPDQTFLRYVKGKTVSPFAAWRFNNQIKSFNRGKVFRVEAATPFTLHWSPDNWTTSEDTASADTGLGMHIVNIPADKLAGGTGIVFTFFWTEAGTWEGRNFEVKPG